MEPPPRRAQGAKTRKEGRTATFPHTPGRRPPFPSAERSEGATIHVGFSAKKVRTSVKNFRKIPKNSESPERGEIVAECGGRRGIPPQTPPAAPPAPCLAFSGRARVRAKGAQAVAERARSRTRRALTSIYPRLDLSSQWLEAAHFRFRGGQWRALGSDPYDRSAPSHSCLWSERHGRRFTIPVVAGRGQKSAGRSESQPLLVSAQNSHPWLRRAIGHPFTFMS